VADPPQAIICDERLCRRLLHPLSPRVALRRARRPLARRATGLLPDVPEYGPLSHLPAPLLVAFAVVLPTAPDAIVLLCEGGR